MDHLPCLQKQDSGENSGGYRAKKLPVVLPEVQAGKFGQRETTEYISY